MSKYIIEIEEKPLCVFDKDTQTYFPRLWRVKGFNSLVLDEEGLSRLEELNSDYINEHCQTMLQDEYDRGYKDGRNVTETQAHDDAYHLGLNDAWEAAKKLYLNGACKNLFGEYFNTFIKNHTAQEAIEKLKAYEEKRKADDEIKVGDEVIYNNTTKCLVVRPESNDKYATLIDSNGNHHHAEHSECKKTGRHFEIEKILEAMK